MSRPTNNNRSLVLYRSQVAGPMPARRPRMFRKRKRAPYLAPLTRVSRMPTYRNSIGPPETDVTLVYTETSTISAAATFQSKVWNVNAPFQPDPSTGGSVPGFNEWAGLYKFCRTIKVWCKADLCNLQAFPCVGYMYLGNASPGTGMPFSIVGNALTCYAQMSAVGGLDRCTLSLTATICDIVGSNAPETDDNYRSLVTAVPADLSWLAIGVQSNTGANIALGCSNTLVVRMLTRFYDRAQLAS